MKMKLALAQMNLTFGDTADNLRQAKEIAKGLSPGSMLMLPELWSSSYDLENTAVIAQENNQVLEEIRKTSRDQKIYISGSLLQNIEGKTYNSLVVTNPEGEVSAAYQKIHLFRLMDEHKWMSPGKELAAFLWQDQTIGLSICYDLRFPEIFRKYALRGCKAIILVAEWPIQRINHWKVLLQARAIENQMYIAAVNCVGWTGDTQFGGNSMIVDPWGNILVEGSTSETNILTGEMDLTTVDQTRRKIPIFEDRRPEIYANQSVSEETKTTAKVS